MQQRVTHAEVQEVTWGRSMGPYEMKVLPGTREKIEADLILLAMGFVHPVHEGLLSELKVELNPRKNIRLTRTWPPPVKKCLQQGMHPCGASLVVNCHCLR
jgi:glutamate synthase (NADPH/NADH) small chain